VEGALVVGGVAQETDGDLVAPLHLDGLGHAGGEGEGPAHQGVTAHETVLHVEQVHGAPAALGAAGLLAEQFGHHRLGIGAALDGMDVIPVAGDDVVVAGPGRLHHPVHAGLLAGVEMEETTDLAFHVGFVATLLEAPRRNLLICRGNREFFPCPRIENAL